MTWLMIQLGMRVRWRLEKVTEGQRSVATLTATKNAVEETRGIVNKLIGDGWTVVSGPGFHLESY